MVNMAIMAQKKRINYFRAEWNLAMFQWECGFYIWNFKENLADEEGFGGTCIGKQRDLRKCD
jgi:hypothetical protein